VKRKRTKNNKTVVDSSRPTTHDSRPLNDSRFTFFSDSRLHIACLVCLVLIIYANTFSAPFQWDEKTFIAENPIVRDFHYFARPSEAKGFELHNALINRYIGYLTFALNYKLHGLAVTGYHIVNVTIHIANTLLVYLLVLLTFRAPFFKTVKSEEVNGEWIKEEEVKIKPFSLFTIHYSRSLIAFFSAAIFAVHPLQTEAVTYVFQRFASLVTFFYLISLVAYIKARLQMRRDDYPSPFPLPQGEGEGGRVSFVVFYAISLLSAVLAMKTKENAFTLPFVIALYEFCFFSAAPHPSLPHKGGGLVRGGTIHGLSRFIFLVPMLLTLLIIPLTLMGLTGSHRLDPGSYGAAVFSRGDYFLTQFRVIVTYLRLLFFPVAQNLNYDYPLFKSFFDPNVILSFVFLAAFFAFGLYMIIGNRQWAIGNGIKAEGKEDDSRFTPPPPIPPPQGGRVREGVHDSRCFRLIGFGILWFFITLSVESSIIPLPMLINEYRVYLPSVGLIISAVTGAFLVFSRFTIHVSRPLASRFLIAALVFIIGGLSVATHLRNELWADKITLWEDVADKSPYKATVHLNLGLVYQERSMLDKAIEQYLIAARLQPDLAMAHYNLGFVYQSLNLFEQAVGQYLVAVKLDPRYAAAGHSNLGALYRSHNMPDKAIEQYLIAVTLKPDFAIAHFNLGLVYYKTGQIEKAEQEMARVLELLPDNQQARALLRKISEKR
jgi:tetratricopeptide (TPR) repeat protein